jgi:hypothetical protein
MICKHHELEFELPDEWLTEAGLSDPIIARDCYLPDLEAACGQDVFNVPIDSIEPLIERAARKGVFCDDDATGETAKQRVLRILRKLKSDQKIEPVKVVRSQNPEFSYKLTAGSHRFYCAIALGCESVPATIGFDINDPYA